MALSLTNLHIRFLLVLLLALGAIGYANFTLYTQGASLSPQQASVIAREVAATVDLKLRTQATLARQIATAVDADKAVSLRTTERNRRERELAALIAGSTATILVAVDRNGAPERMPDMDLALIDPLRNAIRTKTLEAARPIVVDNKPTAYALYVPLGPTDKPPAGYVIVQFPLTELQTLLTRAASGVGHIDVITGSNNVVLLSTDDTVPTHDAPTVISSIGKSGWALRLWPQSKPIAIEQLPFREAGIVLAALAFVLLAGFRLWQRSTRNVRHDVMSLLRMFKDVRDGNMRVDYPLRLKDFSDVYQYLRHSGRKMLKEKKRLKTMGLVDHLSQLSNRRHFEMRLKELFELSKTHGPSSVLIIDVDHFKRVNDEHGHDAGDALITGFAKALRQSVRQSDLLVRLGGDEFCVVYPYTELERAVSYAERLRRQLPREIPLLKGIVHEVRWTGGLSMMAEKDDKFDDVLWRADQALIQAKEAGRNVLRVFDPVKGLEKKPPMAAN